VTQSIVVLSELAPQLADLVREFANATPNHGIHIHLHFGWVVDDEIEEFAPHVVFGFALPRYELLIVEQVGELFSRFMQVTGFL